MEQQCDRQYPCDRCSRRRQPELCAYYPTASPTSSTGKSCDDADNMHIASDIGAGAGSGSGLGLKVAVLDPEKKDSFKSPDAGSSPTSASSATPARRQSTSSSLVETFGYYGASEFSTLALVRKVCYESRFLTCARHAAGTGLLGNMFSFFTAGPRRRHSRC